MTNPDTPSPALSDDASEQHPATKASIHRHFGTAASSVRPIRRTDISEIAQVLARAFHDDPVMMWLLPDPIARTRALPKMFATMIRHRYRSGGGAELADDHGAVAAAALWDEPGHWKTTRAQALLMSPALLWGFRARITMTETVLRATSKTHPAQRHWYLMSIGTDPSYRGRGFADGLMRSRLQRCDAEHLPAHLEATKPELLQFYTRFGFDITGEIALPNGPKLWPMWREPR